jgi:ADP-ribosyl-[dinitrogen reductase] hydrolase
MTSTLLGGAIGDALGVPFESKPADNPLLLSWDQKSFLGSQHHNLTPGQFSDDTQFSLTVAQSLIDNNGFNPDDLSKRYVELFTSDTIRGYGKTTLAAVQNLQSGIHWSQSGIAGSYGNGTAMRAAPLGVWFRNSHIKDLVEACKIDAQITHASEEAIAGSIAIALAAFWAVNRDTNLLLEKIHPHLPDSKVKNSIYSLGSLIEANHISPSSALGFLGTRADVRMTVPSALYCFLKHDNYHDAVLAAINAGGDTDTTASIVGALFGAKDGTTNIPTDWIFGVENYKHISILDSQLYNRTGKLFFPRN